MRNRTLCFVLVMSLLIVGVGTALAEGPPDSVYVDPGYGGNEEGTKSNPYNTRDEGEAYLRSLPDGGDLYVKNADGEWEWAGYVEEAESGGTGESLPPVTLYLLLALLTLGALFVGWRLLRRARQVGY